jgi:hypothetical protein
MSRIAQKSSFRLRKIEIDMNHPFRTLLYELFAPPPLRLLQRPLEVSVSAAGLLLAYVRSRKTIASGPECHEVKKGAAPWVAIAKPPG